MKTTLELLLLLFLPVPILAQNCTGTAPTLNVGNIISGTSAVVGDSAADNGCPANSSLPGCFSPTAQAPTTATGTITVHLTAAFNSQTGWVTLFRVTNQVSNGTGSTSITDRGWNRSYPIISGNSSPDLVLRAPGITSGSFGGTWVTDLKYTGGTSARDELIEWSTPGFNSSSVVSFAGDIDARGLPGNTGAQSVSQDTTVGVSYHSVTLHYLDTLVGATTTETPTLGLYWFTAVSQCFTAGAPDPLLGVSMALSSPYSCMPNQDCGNAQLSTGTGTGPSMQFLTGTANVVAGQNTFSMQAYNHKPSYYYRIPVQDGIHNGFRTAAGAQVLLPYGFFDATIPVAGSNNGVSFTVADWAGPGLITNFVIPAGNLPPTGTATNGSGISGTTMNIPSTVPATDPGCSSNAGTFLTLNDGIPACAYPIKITGTKNAAACGTTIYCGPEGTTQASCPNPASPCNIPDIAELWVIVMDTNAMWPVKGTVGPWINPMSGMPGIRCETYARQGAAADNCLNQSWGQVGVNGQYVSYEGQQQDNCVWNGNVSPAQVVTNDSTWFYDGAYVCHTLEVMYGQPHGTKTGVSASNESYVQHILGAFLDSWMPRRNDITLTGTYPVTANAIRTVQSQCDTLQPGGINGKATQCGIMEVPVQNAGPIADMLDAGQTLRACFNTPGATNGLNYSCGVLGTNTPPRAFTVTLTAGGDLPASTTLSIDTIITGPDGLQSYISNQNPLPSRTTDATCPASGNCSITVSVPAMTNATGFIVYANNYLQSPTPTAMTSSYVIGGPGNPLQTTNVYGTRPGSGQYNAFTAMVVSADRVNNTIIVDSSTTNPLPGVNTRVVITKAFVGIPADAGSNGNTIICANCQFGNIQRFDTVYCGGAAEPGQPLFSSAPFRGSLVDSIDAPNHTLHLVTSINCNAGTKFEIRTRLGHPAGIRIFSWGTSPYDQWERFHNYLAADMVLYLSHNSSCNANGPFNNCSPPGVITPSPSLGGWDAASRREISLAIRNCQLALDINDETGGNTALSPSASCLNPATQRNGLSGLMQMMDTQINNEPGNGNIMGSFLNGLQMRSLLFWWLDPKRGAGNDPRYLYWAKAMADEMWKQAEGAESVSSPNCTSIGGTNIALAPNGIPQHPSEWPYIINKRTCGGGPNFTIGTRIVSDYWSIYGNVYPAYAFFYQYTGNAVIPRQNRAHPNFTYGQAYEHIASFGFVYQLTNAAWEHPKTLGEMGLWQEEALEWMKGTQATGGPLTITTSSLPGGTVGMPYTGFLSATGGTFPYMWSATGLPSGLSLSGSSITGTPSAAFSGNVNISVTDSEMPPATVSGMLPLTIASAPPPVITQLPEFTYPIP